MIYYPALIERSADGYGLLFPDVPGCVTTGRDAAELMAHAIEALTLHLESLREDGDPIPQPGIRGHPTQSTPVASAAGTLCQPLLPGRSRRPSCVFNAATKLASTIAKFENATMKPRAKAR